jgi:aminopeptidase N
MKFTNSYVNNSSGFHRFEDPVDQEVYMYSHLEPFYCHRWFPCFDQPDLRAKLKLQVLTPESKWKVIANEKL